MSRFFLFACCLFFVLGCAHSRFKPSPRQKEVNAIRRKTAREIEKELDLFCCGTAGQIMNGIKMVGLSFDCRRPLDINDARRLVVAATQTLINAINLKESIRPHLDHYPVGAEMVWMQIGVQARNGNSLELDSLCMVTANQGVIEYNVKDSGQHRLSLVLQETYQEALEKLHLEGGRV